MVRWVFVISGLYLFISCGLEKADPLSEGNYPLPNRYYDSIFDMDLSYPRDWTLTKKRTFGNRDTIYTFSLVPASWQRTYVLEIQNLTPLRPFRDSSRTLEALRTERDARVWKANPEWRLDSTHVTHLGLEPAYVSWYSRTNSFEPYLQVVEWIAVYHQKFFSLTFTIDLKDYQNQLPWMWAIARQFRFFNS